MHKQYRKEPYGFLIVIFLYFLYGSYIVLCFLNGDISSATALEKTGVVPYDSYAYAYASEANMEAEYDWYSILGGALNWGAPPIVYGLFMGLGDVGGLLFALFNLTLICIAAGILISEFSLRSGKVMLFLVLFVLLNPYFIGWVIAPNKELIVLAAVVLLFRFANERKYICMMMLAIFAGAFKVQIFISVALFLLSIWMPRRYIFALLGISLIAPLIYEYYSGFNIESFVANAPDEIRSASIMETLEAITKVPLGFVLAGLLRFILNIFAGLKAGWLFEGHPIGLILPGLTSIILAILGGICLLRKEARENIKAMASEKPEGVYFLFCFLLISSLVPFLQPRYYWWLIPYFIIFNINKRSIRYPKVTNCKINKI